MLPVGAQEDVLNSMRAPIYTDFFNLKKMKEIKHKKCIEKLLEGNNLQYYQNTFKNRRKQL